MTELIGQTFVQRREGSATRSAVDARLTGLGFHLSRQHTILEVSSVQAQLGLIAAGQGIGFVSSMACGSYEQDRVISIGLVGVRITRGLYMIKDPAVENAATTAVVRFMRINAESCRHK